MTARSLDDTYAERLTKECSTGDIEANGGKADAILCELLRKLGMTQTAEAYENLELWRA